MVRLIHFEQQSMSNVLIPNYKQKPTKERLKKEQRKCKLILERMSKIEFVMRICIMKDFVLTSEQEATNMDSLTRIHESR